MHAKTNKVRQMTQLAMLVAITLVMAYTPLGYFRTPILSVSFLTVPVAIGAMLMGPVTGAILGTVFGLTSFADAFTGQGMKAVLLSINPVYCFITTVFARLLCGLLCGLAFYALNKVLHGKKLAYVLSALICPACNTLFFMGFIMLFYFNTDYVQGMCAQHGVTNPVTLTAAMVGVQGLIELVVCGIVASAVTIPLARYLKK